MNRDDHASARRRAIGKAPSLVLLFSCIALAGCANRGTSVSPQILALNYSVRTVPDAGALISSVQSGQSIHSLLGSNPCNFTARFELGIAPTIMVNGRPGQTGFNLQILSSTPEAIPTTNPLNCETLDDIQILIGSRSESLAVGGQTSRENGLIWLTNGQHFDTSAFFQSKLTGFDAATEQTSGDFQFINRLSPGSNTVIIVEGSYSMKP